MNNRKTKARSKKSVTPRLSPMKALEKRKRTRRKTEKKYLSYLKDFITFLGKNISISNIVDIISFISKLYFQ